MQLQMVIVLVHCSSAQPCCAITHLTLLYCAHPITFLLINNQHLLNTLMCTLVTTSPHRPLNHFPGPAEQTGRMDARQPVHRPQRRQQRVTSIPAVGGRRVS